MEVIIVSIICFIIGVFFCEIFWQKAMKNREFQFIKGLLYFLAIVYCIFGVYNHSIPFLTGSSTVLFYATILFPYRTKKFFDKLEEEKKDLTDKTK